MRLLNLLRLILLITVVAIPSSGNAQSLNQLLNKGFKILEKEINSPTKNSTPMQKSTSTSSIREPKDCSNWDELGYDSEDLCKYFVNKKPTEIIIECDDFSSAGYEDYESCSYFFREKMKKQGYSTYADFKAGKKGGFADGTAYSAAKSGGFTNSNTYTTAKEMGFNQKVEYQAAVAGGFTDAKTYRAATAAGFSDAKTYSNAKTSGFNTALEYTEGLNGGFKDGKTFAIAKANGFSNAKDYEAAKAKGLATAADLEAVKQGYSDRHQLEKAKAGGFKSARKYKDAIAKGFKSAKTYDEASWGKFTDAKSYSIARAKGFTDAKSFAQAAAMGATSHSDYLAKRAGFIDAKEHALAKKGGFSDANTYRLAKSNGFYKKSRYTKSKSGGFTNSVAFDDATAKGISDHKCYDNFVDYGRTIEEWGVIRAERYIEYMSTYAKNNREKIDFKIFIKNIKSLKLFVFGNAFTSDYCRVLKWISSSEDLATFIEDLDRAFYVSEDKKVLEASDLAYSALQQLGHHLESAIIDHISDDVGEKLVSLMDKNGECLESSERDVEGSIEAIKRFENLDKCYNAMKLSIVKEVQPIKRIDKLDKWVSIEAYKIDMIGKKIASIRSRNKSKSLTGGAKRLNIKNDKSKGLQNSKAKKSAAVEGKISIDIVDVSELLIATSDINVRIGPGTSTRKIGKLKKGEKVNVIGHVVQQNSSKHKWKKISFNGEFGFVFGKYLDATNVQRARTGILKNYDRRRPSHSMTCWTNETGWKKYEIIGSQIVIDNVHKVDVVEKDDRGKLFVGKVNSILGSVTLILDFSSKKVTQRSFVNEVFDCR
jgi:uncharacterized protein YgiM (DUF1202 family)